MLVRVSSLSGAGRGAGAWAHADAPGPGGRDRKCVRPALLRHRHRSFFLDTVGRHALKPDLVHHLPTPRDGVLRQAMVPASGIGALAESVDTARGTGVGGNAHGGQV
ncbi:hypothetical protein GCM10010249_48900 [Streptomyces roseolilacinus]|uniref:Uncharacterized protein n=1 Tax=Streptomyces roseolilacinus TaxID=66904 RepID=A0A918B661_9ACTN|nr:hypothetical protein GCM10010249_48900 [Streptomyces roseolilacinus]